MNRKRDRLEIIHDMLIVIQKKGRKVKPTHIMYKANLSSQMLADYLQEMLKRGFVLEIEEKNSRKTYSLTDKGFRYLTDYAAVRGFVDSYGLD